MHTMNSRSTRLAAALAGLIASLEASAAALDLRAAIEEALRANPAMAIAQARVEQAESAQSGAEGAHLPRLKLSLTLTRSNDALNAFGMKLAQERVSAADFNPAVLNHPAAVNNVNSRIEAQFPLYTGGQIQAEVERARALARAARQGDTAARQELAYQVAVAYQGVHTARAYLGVAEQAEAAARETLRASEHLHREGVVTRADVLAARAHLEEARLGVVRAKNRLASAEDGLRRLLGRGPLDRLELAAGLTAVPLEANEAELLASALAEHPRLVALREHMAAASAAVEAARAGKRPQVAAMARHDWNDKGIGLRAASYTLAGVLSWNAFDGGLTNAEIGRARAAQAEVEAELRQAEATIVFELREAIRQARTREAESAGRRAALADAEEAHRLTVRRHENGLATLADRLASATRLDQARAAWVENEHARALSRVEIQRAAGRLDPAQL